jgi:hypothetical protein
MFETDWEYKQIETWWRTIEFWERVVAEKVYGSGKGTVN